MTADDRALLATEVMGWTRGDNFGLPCWIDIADGLPAPITGEFEPDTNKAHAVNLLNAARFKWEITMDADEYGWQCEIGGPKVKGNYLAVAPTFAAAASEAVLNAVKGERG